MQKAILGCTLMAPLAAMPARAPDPIRISTGAMPPLSIEAAPATPGALHEVVTELMRRSRLAASIEFVPWQRALYLTGKRSRSAIFPLTRSPERETQFRWLVQLYLGSFVILSMKNSAADAPAPKEQRIGVLRGSLMIKKLKDNGYRNIVEASTIEENVRLLRRGMVDAVAGERAIYRAALKGQVDDEHLSSETVMSTGMWLAGSLDFNDAETALLQKNMKNMVDDGSYARIVKKYDIVAAP